MTETEPTNQPAECPDACTEQHTYGPDCAAMTDAYDPTAGLRDRYAEALAKAAGSKAFSPANAGTEWEHSRAAWYAHADAVLAVRDAELVASQRRTVTLVERIDAARAWARQHLTPELETGLLRVLRGDEAPELADSCGSCGSRPVTYYAPDGLPACANCAPCDCGTEPCSKPAVARLAALEPPKEQPQ